MRLNFETPARLLSVCRAPGSAGCAKVPALDVDYLAASGAFELRVVADPVDALAGLIVADRTDDPNLVLVMAGRH